MSKAMVKKAAKKGVKKATKSPTKKKATTAPKKSKKKPTKKKKVALTQEQKDQRLQEKEVRNLMENIGFTRAPSVDGKEFQYDTRTTELDDVFTYENVVVVTEYTVGDPGTHLLKKKIIFDKILADPQAFLKFVLAEPILKSLKDYLDKGILKKYTLNQIQLRVLYVSKQAVEDEHKNQNPDIQFFDYSVVKYFESLAKVIKKSTKHEFLDFLRVEFSNVGENIKSSAKATVNDFSGHILPEEHSSFKNGYKIVSFYIDADSLIKRAFVLRRDGWRNKENIGLYQRMFIKKKIKGMRKYLHEKQRVFINNIIVTLPIENIELEDDQGNKLKIDAKGNFKAPGKVNVTPAVIKIQNKSNIIGIIDGQHRCYAYHEGDDAYEKTIASLRGIQNLLVTGILYPKDEPVQDRIKFEAELFLEINTNQAGATTQLKQEIEYIMNPFSTISISKHVINYLNKTSPLAGIFEEYWFEKAKLKTSTIISFGLRPLLKIEGNDTLFKIWTSSKKAKLQKKAEDIAALNEYKNFSATQVRNIFSGLKANIDKTRWVVDRKDPNAVLNVTTINGVINCLRLLVENNKTGDVQYYIDKFKNVKDFQFKKYKSSQYRNMGEALYEEHFK